MKKTELLVMAAGMGSRFGGLKQIEPLGPNGEIILDFSAYDAVLAGFDRIVFVVKKEMESDFREVCGRRIEKMIDIDYAFQETDKLPEGYKLPEGRIKPWGTGHAVLCAEKKISSPFAVINADDFYGRSSYKLVHDWLVSSAEMCMVGYRLGNTLTENGTVCRGICEVKDGYLDSVTEYTNLDKNSGISLDKVVSMNMWGLGKDFFPYLEKQFKRFLDGNIFGLKSEFYLPYAVSKRIEEENRFVRVLESEEKWYGVTYREDIQEVKKILKKLVKNGYMESFYEKD